jgi:hypothetical protein
MRRKAAAAWCVVVAVLVPVVGTMAGEETDAGADEDSKYRRCWALLGTLRQERDLDAVVELAGQIETTWPDRNPERYGYLMLKVCSALRSAPPESRYQGLARESAMLALEKADRMTLDVVFALLMCVESDWRYYDSLRGERWSKERRLKARLWLQAWHRVDSAIDKNWKPDTQLPLNVKPPAETGLPAGVAPESIEDPKLRAEYEAAIEKHNKTVEWDKNQKLLRKLQEQKLPLAEKYIVQAYSRPPYDLAELEKDLEQYLLDDQARARILQSVQASIPDETDAGNPDLSETEGAGPDAHEE